MTSSTYLLVGLCNPGSKYAKTRHNAGAMAVSYLYNDACSQPAWQKKNQGFLASHVVEGVGKCLYLLPQTYMNLSGQSVQSACSFFKVLPEHVIVFHDDLDIPCGTIKIKQGGGHGGHNGLRHIDSVMGKNYVRVRLGIDHPRDAKHDAKHDAKRGTKNVTAQDNTLTGIDPNQPVADYVLRDFTPNQATVFSNAIEKLPSALPYITAKDFGKAGTVLAS